MGSFMSAMAGRIDPAAPGGVDRRGLAEGRAAPPSRIDLSELDWMRGPWANSACDGQRVAESAGRGRHPPAVATHGGVTPSRLTTDDRAELRRFREIFLPAPAAHGEPALELGRRPEGTPNVTN